MKRYEVWCEGYQSNGASSKAKRFGSVCDEDFKSACIVFFERDGNFNPESMTYWGCRLFDNEQDARKSFG